MSEENSKIAEKKERIIHAAIEEFGRQGYLNASTNAIAKEAGVSKGLIFHYYQDKETLHFQCAKVAFDTLLGMTDLEKVQGEKDIFARLFVWAGEKRRMLKVSDNMNRLIVDLMNLPGETAPKAKALFYEKYNHLTEMLVTDVDTSKFPPGRDHREIITFILICFQAMGDFMIRKYSHIMDWNGSAFDEAMDEFTVYVEYIKHGIYRD